MYEYIVCYGGLHEGIRVMSYYNTLFSLSPLMYMHVIVEGVIFNPFVWIIAAVTFRNIELKWFM